MKIIKQVGGTSKYGPCERCKKQDCEIYHIFDISPTRPGMFVCEECAKNIQEKKNDQKNNMQLYAD